MKATIATGTLCALLSLGAGNSECPKKWNKQYDRLTDAERQWVSRQATHHLDDRDLNADGQNDVIDLSSERWMDGCEPKRDWMYKDNIVYVRLTNEQTRLFGWKGGLITQYHMRRNERKIITDEVFIDGEIKHTVLEY